jgi:serine/threonine-protein kinase
VPDLLDRLKTALADRYSIEEELGSGGMATVYLAEDLKHHRKVAVKVLRPELAAVLGAERFLKEIEVTANLQHPHILQLYDSGEADSFLYYVMPYVEGESLRDKLNREKQLSVEESVEITKAVASALDYAHRHDVIHRDIKPENILLHDGQPVVADFGIALAVTAAGGTRLTETGLSLGTPEYMSPEQATGDRELDARSDVYSLASVTYEMLVGDPPHTGSTVQAIISKVITEEPRRVTLARKTVPAHVEGAVHTALAKLPADRFPSAIRFAEALTQSAGPVLAPGGAPTERTWVDLWLKDRRWMGQLVLPWMLFLAAAGVASIVLLGRADGRSGDPAWFAISLPTLARLAPDCPCSEIALSPDGRSIAYVGWGEGGNQLYVRSFDDPEPRPLEGTDRAWSPSFSPDGRWIAFFVDNELRRVAVEGGPPVAIAPAPEFGGPVAWAEDGTMFFVDRGSSVSRIGPDGVEPERVATLGPPVGFYPHRVDHVLPGGKAVLLTLYKGIRDEAEMAILSVETGEVVSLGIGMTPRYTSTGHLVYARSDGVLMAAPFDRSRLQLTGAAVPVAQGVTIRNIGGAEYDVSRDGTLIYVPESPFTVVLVDRAGVEQPLFEIDLPGFSPRFSPDGGRVALAVGRLLTGQVQVYSLNAGTLTPLTFGGQDTYPIWTPDGQSITFSSSRGGDFDLYSKRIDGNTAPERLLASEGRQYPASWTADGRSLVFRTVSDVARDLYVLTTEGDQAPEPFTNTPHLEYAPALSPDDRWLAYSSDLSGQLEVYVEPYPSGGAPYQVSTEGGMEPVWSRDGRELFYREEQRFVAARIATNPFRVEQREVLFEKPYAPWFYHSNYDVHPDGERFVMINPSGEGRLQITVVLNWFEELKAKVGN